MNGARKGVLLAVLLLLAGCITTHEYRSAGQGFGFLGRGSIGQVRSWEVVYGEPGSSTAALVHLWPAVRDPETFVSNGEWALFSGTGWVACDCGLLRSRLREREGRLIAGCRDGRARDITLMAASLLCERAGRHVPIGAATPIITLAIKPMADGATVRLHVDGIGEFGGQLTWAEIAGLLGGP